MNGSDNKKLPDLDSCCLLNPIKPVKLHDTNKQNIAVTLCLIIVLCPGQIPKIPLDFDKCKKIDSFSGI